MNETVAANENPQIYFNGSPAGYILLESEQAGHFSFMPYRNFAHLNLANAMRSGIQPAIEIRTAAERKAALVVAMTPRSITLRKLEALQN